MSLHARHCRNDRRIVLQSPFGRHRAGTCFFAPGSRCAARFRPTKSSDRLSPKPRFGGVHHGGTRAMAFLSNIARAQHAGHCRYIDGPTQPIRVAVRYKSSRREHLAGRSPQAISHIAIAEWRFAPTTPSPSREGPRGVTGRKRTRVRNRHTCDTSTYRTWSIRLRTTGHRATRRGGCCTAGHKHAVTSRQAREPGCSSTPVRLSPAACIRCCVCES